MLIIDNLFFLLEIDTETQIDEQRLNNLNSLIVQKGLDYDISILSDSDKRLQYEIYYPIGIRYRQLLGIIKDVSGIPLSVLELVGSAKYNALSKINLLIYAIHHTKQVSDLIILTKQLVKLNALTTITEIKRIINLSRSEAGIDALSNTHQIKKNYDEYLDFSLLKVQSILEQFDILEQANFLKVVMSGSVKSKELVQISHEKANSADALLNQIPEFLVKLVKGYQIKFEKELSVLDDELLMLGNQIYQQTIKQADIKVFQDRLIALIKRWAIINTPMMINMILNGHNELRLSDFFLKIKYIIEKTYELLGNYGFAIDVTSCIVSEFSLFANIQSEWSTYLKTYKQKQIQVNSKNLIDSFANSLVCIENEVKNDIFNVLKLVNDLDKQLQNTVQALEQSAIDNHTILLVKTSFVNCAINIVQILKDQACDEQVIIPILNKAQEYAQDRNTQKILKKLHKEVIDTKNKSEKNQVNSNANDLTESLSQYQNQSTHRQNTQNSSVKLDSSIAKSAFGFLFSIISLIIGFILLVIKNIYYCKGCMGRAVFFIYQVILMLIFSGLEELYGDSAITGQSLLLWTFFILPLLSSIVRRLHDIDFSGWFVLVFLIPFVNFVFYILLFFIPSRVSRYAGDY